MSTEVSIGIITLVLGCLALYVSRSQDRTEREAAIHSAFVAVSESFIAYPALRPIFYEDESEGTLLPDLSDPETRLRANAVAELLLDTLEMAHERRHTRQTYEDYTSLVFERSAFMTQWAISHRPLYPDALVEFALVAHQADSATHRGD